MDTTMTDTTTKRDRKRSGVTELTKTIYTTEPRRQASMDLDALAEREARTQQLIHRVAKQHTLNTQMCAGRRRGPQSRSPKQVRLVRVGCVTLSDPPCAVEALAYAGDALQALSEKSVATISMAVDQNQRSGRHRLVLNTQWGQGSGSAPTARRRPRAVYKASTAEETGEFVMKLLETAATRCLEVLTGLEDTRTHNFGGANDAVGAARRKKKLVAQAALAAMAERSSDARQDWTAAAAQMSQQDTTTRRRPAADSGGRPRRDGPIDSQTRKER